MPQPATLARKTGVVVASRLLTSAIDLATGIALVRLLAKSDFAVLSFLLVVYGTARYVATLGFPDSVFFFFERVAKGARRAFVLQTCAILAATSLVSAGGILLFSTFAPDVLSGWSPAERAAVLRYLPWMAFVAALEIPTWPTTNVLLALDRQRDAGLYEMLTSALTFTGLVGPLALGLGVDVAVYGLAAYAVLRFVGSLAWLWRVLPPHGERLPAGLLRSQVTFAVPLGLNALVGRLSKYVDRFVVSALLPAAALAEYSVGAQEIPLVAVIPAAVGSVLISRYVALQLADQKAELLGLWYRSIEKTALVVVPITVLFIASAPDFVGALFGDGYGGAVVPFQLYSLIVLHRVTSYGGILQVFGDTRGLLTITVSLLFVNAALAVPLTLALGINGTALAAVLANGVSWALVLRRIGGHLGLPARRVLPFPFYLRVLGVSAACGAGTYALRHTAAASLGAWGGLGLSAAVFVTAFALVATAARVVRIEDWRTLAGWLRPRGAAG